ncbi:MAG: sialidase family protein [Bacteroidota bacterium]
MAAPLVVPASSGSGRPFLTTGPAGTVYLSWTEPAPDGRHCLRYAAWTGSEWGDARTIVEGANWFVNWADVPQLAVPTPDRLVAHVLPKSGPGTYAYDVAVHQSLDGGATWTGPLVPHTDGTMTEHGFVSYVPLNETRLGLVWLDGRAMAGSMAGPEHDHAATSGAMSLRFAALTPAGTFEEAAVLDLRTCECCPTAAVHTAQGPAIFYRDRGADERRDIVVVRRLGDAWTVPTPVHDDGWIIAGCPVNGPAADAAGDDVIVAWYTQANGQPKVQLARSGDAGATFSPPILIDGNRPLGRVDTLLRPDGTALVLWLQEGEDGGRLLLRAVSADGTVGAVRLVAEMSMGRTSGVPRMALTPEGTVLVVWTDAGPASDGELATRVRSLALSE